MKLSKLVFAMIAGVTATASFSSQSVAQNAGQTTAQNIGQKTGQKMSSYAQSTGQAVGQKTSQAVGQTTGQATSQNAAQTTNQATHQRASQLMPSASQSVEKAAATITAGDIVNNGGYIQDSRGLIVRNSSGLCVRTGYWTPELAQAECEAPVAAPVAVVAPVAKPYVAPVIVTPPVEAPKPVVQPVEVPKLVVQPVEAPKPVVTLEKVTFAADAFFDTDKAILKPEAKVKLDDLAQKVKGIALEVIIAVGHTDSDASDAYNDKLSIRRAAAVKSYLISRGIDANRVLAEGKGEKQPVASNATKPGKAQNRRVEVEVVGTRSVTK